MVAVTALSGLAGHVVNGQVEWRLGLLLAVAAIAGGLLGSRMTLSVNKGYLRKTFGIAVWLLAIRIIRQLIF